jgi:hypothetical protein
VCFVLFERGVILVMCVICVLYLSIVPLLWVNASCCVYNDKIGKITTSFRKGCYFTYFVIIVPLPLGRNPLAVNNNILIIIMLYIYYNNIIILLLLIIHYM